MKGTERSRLYVVGDKRTIKMNGMARNDDVGFRMSLMASPASRLLDILKVSTIKLISSLVCKVASLMTWEFSEYRAVTSTCKMRIYDGADIFNRHGMLIWKMIPQWVGIIWKVTSQHLCNWALFLSGENNNRLVQKIGVKDDGSSPWVANILLLFPIGVKWIIESLVYGFLSCTEDKIKSIRWRRQLGLFGWIGIVSMKWNTAWEEAPKFRRNGSRCKTMVWNGTPRGSTKSC